MRARVSASIRVTLATIAALTAAARADTPAPAAGPPTARHLSAPSDGIGFGVVPQLGGLKSMTIAVRLKVDPDDFAGAVRSIASVWGPGAGPDDLTFALRQASGKFVVYFQRSGGFYGINTVDGPLLRDGRPDPGWNTYFFRWAAGQKNLGVFKGDPACFSAWATDADISGLTSLPSPATGELWVGREPASGAAFPPVRGAVADLAFFGGALSEGDMRWIAAGAAPSSATSAPLLFWAPLAGGGATESTAATSDGVTRTGAVSGTATVPAPFAAPLMVHSNIIISPADVVADAGFPSTLTVRWGILGPAASPVTLTPSASHGTFSPTSVSLGTDPGAAVTFTYTPGYSAGSDTIAVTPGGGLPAVSVPATIALPPARIAGARVLPHGQSLLLDFAGPDGAPARLAAKDDRTPAVAVLPTISINGGAPIALIGPLAPASQTPPSTPYYMSWATFLLPSTPPSLARVAAQDPASFRSSGGWAPGIPGFQGKGLLANANAGGNDLDATATYTLSGLEAGGTYDLHATWSGYSPLCPGATYTAHDGPASGPVLGTWAVDQTKVPSARAADPSPPAGTPPWVAEEGLDWAFLGRVTPTGATVTVVLANGSRSGVLMADGLRIERVRQFTTIGPDDVVTLSAPQRWATTEAGVVAGVTDLAVANLSGGALSPVAPDTKTMKVGWNTEEPYAYASSASFYNNRYNSVYNYTLGPDGFGAGHTATTDGFQNLTGLTYDDGPPVRCSPLYLTVSQNSGDGVGPRWLASCPPDGTWTLKWRGQPGILSLVGLGTGDVTEALGEAVDPATGENVARTRIAAGPGATAPTVSLRFFHPTDPSAVPVPGSIKVFDPLADPTESTLFSPYFLDKIAGAACLRHLDTFCYANPDAAEFSHLSDDSVARLGVNFPTRTLGGDVIRISPVDVSPTNADKATWYFRNASIVKLVFAAPHGLSNGQFVAIGIGDPETFGIKNFPTVTGGYLEVVGGLVIVLDPTTAMITCAGAPGKALDGGTDTIAQDYTPPTKGAWPATCRVGMGPSLDTIIELGRVTGAIQWLSLPHPVTDDCCTRIGEYLVAHTPPGRKFAIEYSNEVWNFNGGFVYASVMANYNSAAFAAGVPDVPGMGYNARNWYTYRAGQIHKLIRAPFEAAGRGDDLIRVMGSQTGYAAGVTFPTVDVAEQFKIPIDWLAIDGYLDNESAGGRYDPAGMPAVSAPLIDAMNVGQLIDLFAVHIRRDNSTRYIDPHRQLLDRHGFSGTKLVVYEGSIGNAVPSPRTYNRVPTAQALLRHPDLYPVLLDWFQVQQDAGISLFNWFLLDGGPFVAQGAGWACYPSYGMRPGRGDGGDGRFDNRSNFQDLRKIVSVEGAAVRDWARMAGQAVTPPPVPPVTPPPPPPPVTPDGTIDLPPGEYGLDVVTRPDGKMRLRVRAKTPEAATTGK